MEISQSRDHVSVEIQEDSLVPPIIIQEDSLVSPIKKQMETKSTSACIFRGSSEFHKGNDNAYIPGKVSIGPFHHGTDALKVMEDNKWRYVHALLNRKPNLEASLDGCVKALRKLEHRARRCYSEEISFTSNEFIEIMLIDGCFIIELFFKYAFKSLRRRSDPIFSTPGMFFDLRSDMMLIGNQIPYFILQRLFQIVPIPTQCSLCLHELAFRFFKSMIPGDQKALWEKIDQEGNHLLDFIFHCFLPTYTRVPSKSGTNEGLNCATHLQQAGIRFKKAATKSLLDVKFVNGVLEIPPLTFHKRTETLFCNLIALEQCYCDGVQHIASYAFLMSSLVRSEKDVKLLGRQEILIHEKNKEKEVPELLRKLCGDKIVQDFYYSGLSEQVEQYRRTGLLVWWQEFKRDSLKTPASRLLFILVILILVLSVVGAFFSVFSFCLHKM
nr:UPF0481 protein At3g47200-like [Quercus suber]POE81033.1 upf0481 protein [Quercus suber]